MLKDLDELDMTLLNRIREHEGEHVRDIIKPLFLEKSESALRSRIQMLELRKLIRIEKTKSALRCYIGENAEAVVSV